MAWKEIYSKRTSHNTLSLFWAQNKDLGATSQTLLTKVKLRQQCAMLTKTLLLKFDVNEANKFLHKTWSSLPWPAICMYQCMVLYKPCFHSNNRFLDHLDRLSCPGQIINFMFRSGYQNDHMEWKERHFKTDLHRHLHVPLGLFSIILLSSMKSYFHASSTQM